MPLGSDYLSVNRFRDSRHLGDKLGKTVLPLTRSSVRLLDNCVKQTVAKMFKVYNTDSIDFVRQQCDWPYIGKLIEKRRLIFVNKLLECSSFSYRLFV